MTALWRLAERLSRLLEPFEREAVLGDLEEAGVQGAAALRQIAGLVVRRQIELWNGWRPWLATLGIAIPAAYLLRLIALEIVRMVWMNLRTYRHFGVRYQSGLPAAEDIAFLVCHLLTVLLCAWTSGFAIASLSRRTIWINAAIFSGIWFFYGGFWLVLIPAIPCLVPFLYGLKQGWGFKRGWGFKQGWGLKQESRRGNPTRRRAIVFACVTVSLTALAAWTQARQLTAVEAWSGGLLHASSAWPVRPLLTIFLAWPTACLVLTGKPLKR
jgi:hypothetical protein